MTKTAAGSALRRAIDRADAKAAREALDAGADPDGAGSEGIPPVGLASRGAPEPGRLACLRAVLAAGADPSGKDELGRSALHHAAGQDNEPALRVLLDAGADPDSRHILGEGPLMCAAYSRAAKCAAALVGAMGQHGLATEGERAVKYLLLGGDSAMGRAMEAQVAERRVALIAVERAELASSALEPSAPGSKTRVRV